MNEPEYLVIGHLCKDRTNDGYTFGGTVAYAAVTAQRLGLRVAIVTAAEQEYVEEFQRQFPDIDICNRISSTTTTFENVYYDGGSRRQRLLTRAAEIRLRDVPTNWRNTEIIHFGPVAREFKPALIAELGGLHAVRILTPQGFLRKWDQHGVVSPKQWRNATEVLQHVTTTILSRPDIGPGHARVIRRYANVTSVILTLGELGSVHYNSGVFAHPRKTIAVDPTGAGDVFAAAFSIEYRRFGKTDQAARFANIVASLSIEGKGLSAIPEESQVYQNLVDDAHSEVDPLPKLVAD